MEIDTDPRTFQAAYLLAQHADRYPEFYKDKQGRRCQCLGQVTHAILTDTLLTQEEKQNERRTPPLPNQSL